MATPLLHHLRSSHCLSQYIYINPFAFLRSLHALHKPDTASTMKAILNLCNSGRTVDARHLFDEMPDKNVVAFSVMIHGYATSGLFSQSLHLFSVMQESGVQPNSFTLVATALCSAGMRDRKLGQSIHGRAVKSGLEFNRFLRSALLSSYAKCGDTVDSYALFKEDGCSNLVTYNAMIAGFTQNDQFEEALMLFKQLRQSGLSPNSMTVLSIAPSCGGYGSFRLCESMYSYVLKSGLSFNIMVMNAIFDMYLSFGNIEIVTGFFEKMAVKDVISWTAMMGFLLEIGLASESLDIFRRMRADGIVLDMVVMINAIEACAVLGDVDRGRLVHSQIMVLGFRLKLRVLNALITMYSSGGDLKSARTLFDCAVDRSLVSWTALVSGYVQNGQPREGLSLLNRMRKEENFDMDLITMVTALAACNELVHLELCKQFHGHSFKAGIIPSILGENSLVSTYGKCGCLDISQKVFADMINRDIVSWNAMILSYGVNGMGIEAILLFHDMEKSGMEPDTVTYLNLLTACSHGGLVDDGLIIFEKMVKEEKIKPTPDHCSCVVDILSRAGCLADATKLVSSMPEKIGPNAWKALLGGCLNNIDLGLAEVAADKVFNMTPDDSSHIVALSNIYASLGKFEKAETLRSRIGKKGLVKNHGFSSLDALPSDFG